MIRAKYWCFAQEVFFIWRPSCVCMIFVPSKSEIREIDFDWWIRILSVVCRCRESIIRLIWIRFCQIEEGFKQTKSLGVFRKKCTAQFQIMCMKRFHGFNDQHRLNSGIQTWLHIMIYYSQNLELSIFLQKKWGAVEHKFVDKKVDFPSYMADFASHKNHRWCHNCNPRRVAWSNLRVVLTS